MLRGWQVRGNKAESGEARKSGLQRCEYEIGLSNLKITWSNGLQNPLQLRKY